MVTIVQQYVGRGEVEAVSENIKNGRLLEVGFCPLKIGWSLNYKPMLFV